MGKLQLFRATLEGTEVTPLRLRVAGKRLQERSEKV